MSSSRSWRIELGTYRIAGPPTLAVQVFGPPKKASAPSPNAQPVFTAEAHAPAGLSVHRLRAVARRSRNPVRRASCYTRQTPLWLPTLLGLVADSAPNLPIQVAQGGQAAYIPDVDIQIWGFCRNATAEVPEPGPGRTNDMYILQTAEYALRAVVWLAREPAAVRRTAEVARATQVPAGYMSKVLQTLARAGLVTSTAGCKGGFRLSRPALHISVLDVMQAVSPSGRIRKCPLNVESHNNALCPLHRRLDEAVASIEKAFASTSIAELLEEGDGRPPLCEPPANGQEPVASADGPGNLSQRSGRAGRRRDMGRAPVGECQNK